MQKSNSKFPRRVLRQTPESEHRSPTRQRRYTTIFPRLLLVFTVLALSTASSAAEPEWKAGAAKTVITPNEPIWMSGYGNRDHPAEGTLHDLWCKSLALEDPAGRRAVLVTLDLCGISKSVSDAVCDRITSKFAINRDAIMICCSHTHTGPMIENNLETMFDLSPEESAKIRVYTRSLEDAVLTTVSNAFQRMEPVRIAWATGSASFAVNRRNNTEANVPELRERGELKGPVDHDVPVLCVRDTAGRIKAIVFGYACHCTVLGFYQWSGDYAGFAQIALEKSHPDATALFFAGCGADQNPLPRRTVEYAEQYGHELAGAVESVIRGAMNSISDHIDTRWRVIDLPLDTLPTSDDLNRQLSGTNAYESRRARKLLARLNAGESLSQTYPYPIQSWRLGEDLTWIALGGEVTVGYSKRLKRELGHGNVWVAGYSNDVMAYIPTRRVWDEGGYEAAGAMVYYGLPTRWSGDVEDVIVTKVHELVGNAAR